MAELLLRHSGQPATPSGIPGAIGEEEKAANPAKVHGLFDVAKLTELASGARCLICGGEMQKQQFSMSCSNGHEKLSYFVFDNSYVTQSKLLADALADRGLKVVKADNKEQWSIFVQGRQI